MKCDKLRVCNYLFGLEDKIVDEFVLVIVDEGMSRGNDCVVLDSSTSVS